MNGPKNHFEIVLSARNLCKIYPDAQNHGVIKALDHLDLTVQEGEILGIPAPGCKFTQLQIGMPLKQATDIAGEPTDRGAYITGKAWIPFYFGSDRHRYEMVYKGQGRLIFAGGGVGDWGSGHLIWIIHNANEAAYR